MAIKSIKKAIYGFFGLYDSFVRLKVVEVADPPPQFFPDIEKFLYSGVSQYPLGVMSWNQGGNTEGGEPTIEVVFKDRETTVERIIEHFKKEGIGTEPITVKIRRQN